MIPIKGKAGINRPIICKKCGHRVGYVKIKTRFKVKMLAWIVVFALVLEIVAEFVGRLVFGG